MIRAIIVDVLIEVATIVTFLAFGTSLLLWAFILG